MRCTKRDGLPDARIDLEIPFDCENGLEVLDTVRFLSRSLTEGRTNQLCLLMRLILDFGLAKKIILFFFFFF